MSMVIGIAKFFISILYAFMKLGRAEQKVVFLSRQGEMPSVDFSMLAVALEDSSVKTEMYLSRMEKDTGMFMSNALANAGMILKQMKAIATARVAIIDGYSIPVSILRHKKSLTVIQIWHATGAIKKFGLQTVGTMSEAERKRARILNMHGGYGYFVAPSAQTAGFYAEAFGMSVEKALVTGTPYLDALEDGRFDRREALYASYPELNEGGSASVSFFSGAEGCDRAGRAPTNTASIESIHMSGDKCRRKIVLYVPTYREGGSEAHALQALADALDPQKYVLLVKRHPIDAASARGEVKRENSACMRDEAEGEATAFVQSEVERESAEVVQSEPGKKNIVFIENFLAEELLYAADVVITDYSSLALAAGLVEKPLFFFVYDIEDYRKKPGLNIDPEASYGKYTARDAGALAQMIDEACTSSYDQAYERAFVDRYIEVNFGRCTEALVSFVIECLGAGGG